MGADALYPAGAPLIALHSTRDELLRPAARIGRSAAPQQRSAAERELSSDGAAERRRKAAAASASAPRRDMGGERPPHATRLACARSGRGATRRAEPSGLARPCMLLQI